MPEPAPELVLLRAELRKADRAIRYAKQMVARLIESEAAAPITVLKEDTDANRSTRTTESSE